MNIDSIEQGIVIDHIRAKAGMEVYKFLHLDQLDCAVALIKNAKSTKMGRKDIIKIDDEIDVDLKALGYIDPDITVNVIRDGRIVQKLHLDLPERVVNIIRCKNPRCITTVEPELPQVFELTDREARVYRCAYCESKAERKG